MQTFPVSLLGQLPSMGLIHSRRHPQVGTDHPQGLSLGFIDCDGKTLLDRNLVALDGIPIQVGDNLGTVEMSRGLIPS